MNGRYVRGSRVGLYQIWETPLSMRALSEVDKQQIFIPRNRADYLWEVLRNGIRQIQQHSRTDSSFEELYKCGYLLSMHRYGALLYNGLKQAFAEYLNYTVQVNVAASLNWQFLIILHSYYERHVASLAALKRVLTYLDKVYVPQHDLDNVYTLGLKQFKTTILCDIIQNYLRNICLEFVRNERTGVNQMINRHLFRNITHMLMELGINSASVYQENFEQMFLEESITFFSSEGETLINTQDAPRYLAHVETRLYEEIERSEQCYDQSTTPKIIKVVEHELIRKHMHVLVNMSTGVVYMMQTQRTDDLARMYKLFGRVEEGVEIMFTAISQFIREEGERIISDGSNNEPLVYVQNLLQLKDKIDFYVGLSLANDKHFNKMLNNDFEHILNLNPRSPENIAVFIDDKLKKSLKSKASREEMMDTWDKTMVLFRFIREKDLFQEYYKQLLAGRLLFTKTNEFSEKYFISKLKRECGLQFSRCFDGMMLDMERSANLTDEFRLHPSPSHSEGPSGGLELSVRVLTPVYWPLHAEPNCTLPLNAQQAFDSFREFYTSRHTGRKLKLLPQRGSAEMSYSLNNHIYTLVVQTFQMCILMKFNERDSWTFKDLLQVTGIPSPELRRALNPLIAMGKSPQNVLVKHPNSRTIDETDVFSINNSFFSKSPKIKIQNQGRPESGPELEDTGLVNLAIEKKIYLVKAAIVRIMKRDRRLYHDALVDQVIEALRRLFVPNNIMIKNQIETLIVDEYIARDGNDRRAYVYIT